MTVDTMILLLVLGAVTLCLIQAATLIVLVLTLLHPRLPTTRRDPA